MAPVRHLLGLVLTATTLAAAVGRAEPTPATPRNDEVVVFAAASLTASFRTIATAFETAHPGTKVTLNFAGSPTLVQQIREGAPADVFASADEANMQKLVDAVGVADAPSVFATNALEIAVPKGNPEKITSLADLTRPGLTVVLCGASVPCGAYALTAFARAGLTVPVGSREADVKAVVTKVALGEADAGLVYATDVHAARDRIDGVALAPEHAVSARYPLAVLRDAAHPAVARAFVAFVLSEPGTTILGDEGFQRP